ncbi:hypothetical protein M5D96_008021 [Drosophila gunungcola]|uniref:Uncharacterized protein n=1 Tax=Drosophila gunungcola TaxID=103775 RepID=A0A9P9YM68_9MUSC|nr:hypothetical protein M5D96_008021 [Drosophila gunungcola]
MRQCNCWNLICIPRQMRIRKMSTKFHTKVIDRVVHSMKGIHQALKCMTRNSCCRSLWK